MITVLNYINAFFSVLIMNCIQPTNWVHCSQPLEEWFYPELSYGLQIRNDPSIIYKSERIDEKNS